jgi:type IV secretory pathway VirD2 relaxase
MADDFDLWLGRIGKDGSTRGRLAAAANRVGRRVGSGSVAGRRRFTGERIGRGAGVGRVLGASDRFAGARSRRVVVKARFVRLAGKGQARAVAHLRYLQRDGTTRDGERGTLYSAELDQADGTRFLERGSGDRHQFRFIVAAEDGAEYNDLKPMVRQLMSQAEQDLGTKLDWVAVDHFNTGHPHSHVLLRGVDERGANLVIAREYITHGLRQRAAEIVNRDLGPRTDLEIARAAQREVTAERFTGLDRKLMDERGADGLVRPVHRDGVEQSLRAGRLQTLGRLGLATEEKRGAWRLDPELERTLREMGRRGDIIATMHRELRAKVPDRLAADYAIYQHGHEHGRGRGDEQAQALGPGPTVTGRVVAVGLSDEHADRRYVIVDGVDGRSHYADIGRAQDAVSPDSVVRLTPTPAGVREVDRTVASVAAANGGRYSVDLHLAHDPTVTEAYAEAHVRRLEAQRRTGEVATREPDGTWRIAPDHLERVEAWDRARARETPVRIELLSERPLPELAGRNGVTWLDRELDGQGTAASELKAGFGEDVRRAMRDRLRWLQAEGLMRDGEELGQGRVVQRLERRTLAQAAGQLSRELGLDYAETRPGTRVEGTYRRAVQVGDAKYAVIERSRDFTLVPWRSALERMAGREVVGMPGRGGVSWSLGRSRGPEL